MLSDRMHISNLLGQWISTFRACTRLMQTPRIYDRQFSLFPAMETSKYFRLHMPIMTPVIKWKMDTFK